MTLFKSVRYVKDILTTGDNYLFLLVIYRMIHVELEIIKYASYRAVLIST